MSRLRITLRTVLLTACLSGCVSGDLKAPVATLKSGANRTEIQGALRPLCPTPTTATTEGQILAGLEQVTATQKQAVAPVVTEWDRLNEGAKICRGAR
jgi:hypothetical protein